MIAVDTNVLVGAIQTFDPQLHATARRAVKLLYRQGEQLACFPQNLVEFWNVSTRPANANGLGLSPEQAARYVDRFQALLRLLPETPAVFSTWRKLVLEHRVSGIQVHDARIVAAMTVHQVDRILSFDDDLKRYTGITVVHPADVSSVVSWDSTSPEAPLPLPATRETEEEQIRRVLAATGGNKSKAAQILGIERKTLYRKLDRMKL
ncbi:MAG: helix-turn-helix domain-containing protein [Bryobacteraceae bacterium]